MILVVLGMHKSGTTLISECLHHSGISMVDSAPGSAGYDDGQKWERDSTKAINHQLLGSAGKNSLTVTGAMIDTTFPQVEGQMRQAVSALSARGLDWGFKDPRTCLTYDAWARVLPKHRVVAIYRDPMSVLSHYRRWPGFIAGNPSGAKQVIDLWCDYNQRIADIVERGGVDAIVLSYDDFMRGDHEFHNLQNFLGRPLCDMRKPELVRNRISGVGAWTERLRLAGLRPSRVSRRLERLRKQR